MGQKNSSAASSTANSPVHQPQRHWSGLDGDAPKCTAGGSGGENLIVDVVDAVGREIRMLTCTLTEVSTLSYEDFQRSLTELNTLSRRYQDVAGKRLLFVVRKDSARTLLWRATVRIGCVRINSLTNRIEAHKLLNLAQFVRVLRTFQAHRTALESSSEAHAAEAEQSRLDNPMRIFDLVNDSPSIDASPTHASASPPLLECCICMDRRAEVSLSCTHYFCLPCIAQWKDMSGTCPVCLDVLPADEDDSWVLTERPDVDEVSDRICSDLMALSRSGS